MTVAVAPRPAPELERLTPLDRLEALCDPGSFRAIRASVVSPRAGDRTQPGDGVLAGAGAVDGRPVFCYSQDPSFMGGSLGAEHAETIVTVMRLADRAGAPVVGFVESGGARLQEGHAALTGYGRIFKASVELSSRAPQISIVSGVSAGGGAYSPALTDFVVMTESARMFLTGPRVVHEALGEDVSMAELGGPGVHARNGVCRVVAADELAAARTARALLAHLPSPFGSPPPRGTPLRPTADPAAPVPLEARRVYDIREVIAAIVDRGELLETSADWARNMVTGLARVDGLPVGVIANQPRRLGGVIDAAAAEKGALFVADCDRFGLPLVVLVDTPGFMPGTRQETAGVIRHGASLLRAFAGAKVPRLTVVVRKAYGGAVITMNSKGLGADLVFAWPQAEIGIMAAGQAVGVVHRRRLAEADGPDLLADLADVYAAEHLTAEAAAANGFVDEVIDPAETHDRLAWALGSLVGKEVTVVDPYARIARALRAQPAVERPIRAYAALGDSFTAGTGCGPGEPWADRLANRLAASSEGFVYRNLAVEGATSDQVTEQLGPALQIEPDLVTVVCGANDVLFSVRPDPEAYARRLGGIFRRLRTPLPSVRIVTATAPERWDFLDLGPRTRARLERGIVRFNAVTRTVAGAYEVPCLEVAGHPGLANAQNFTADGLHPSARGHEQAAAAFGRLLGIGEEQR